MPKIGKSRFIAYLDQQERPIEALRRNFKIKEEHTDEDYFITEDGKMHCYDHISIEDIELDGCSIVEVYEWREDEATTQLPGVNAAQVIPSSPQLVREDRTTDLARK